MFHDETKLWNFKKFYSLILLLEEFVYDLTLKYLNHTGKDSFGIQQNGYIISSWTSSYGSPARLHQVLRVISGAL